MILKTYRNFQNNTSPKKNIKYPYGVRIAYKIYYLAEKMSLMCHMQICQTIFLKTFDKHSSHIILLCQLSKIDIITYNVFVDKLNQWSLNTKSYWFIRHAPRLLYLKIRSIHNYWIIALTMFFTVFCLTYCYYCVM